MQVRGLQFTDTLDAKIRDGDFKLILPYHLPLILGHDVAGVVAKVGPRVRQFKLGDEVYARADDLRIGTFAEFVPVKRGLWIFIHEHTITSDCRQATRQLTGQLGAERK